MKKRVLKIGIVCMLLITLTAINFISVGAGLVSYALENSVEVTKTNHENVGFSAYIKDTEGNKSTNANVDLNSQKMNLCLNIEVIKEGYFNGQIKLNESNFEFVSSQSENVNKVTKDTITLNQINAGSDVEVEVTIKPKVNGNFDLSLLNKENELELTGTYKDSTEKDTKIKGTRKVKVAFVSTVTEADINNQIEVLTNDIEMYNGEAKRVLQLSLKVGINNNTYPVKHITSQISVPKIGEEEPQVEEKANLAQMTNWNAKYENNTVTVDFENEPNGENKVNWSNEGNDEIILTYIYGKDAVVDNAMITSKETVTLHDGKTINANENTITVSKDEVRSGVITVKGEIEENIYKGNLYAGVDKGYTAKTEIEVNLDKVAETIYVNENGTSIPSNYNKTTINKNELMKILGDEGSLEISTKTAEGTNVITTVTKTTPENEQGNIEINYPEGVENITIRTTRAQNKGNLVLEHTKTLKAGNLAEIKAVKELTETIDGTFTTKSTQVGTIPTVEVKSELKETTTEAKLEVNRDSLSTVTENKNVEIKATLLSNAEKYDLYRNPTIEIELPQDVQSVNVNSINKLYGEEFTEMTSSQEVIDGRQTIKVQLTGAQTAYKEPGIEGTEIIINADLIFNNKATSKQDTIKMKYTNENANQYKDGMPEGTETVNMEVVSPKGLIATNNMVALNVQTIGEEEKVSAMLEKSAPAKQVKVETEIINNNETPVNNVTILGRFPTNGKQNNLKVALKSGITLDGIDSSKVKVYYTENEEATNDLSNAENAWREQATSETNTKKYLVTVSDMQVVEGMKLSYDIEIPENLDYNQIAEQGYEVSYIESNTGVSQVVKATTIELTTGTGPVVEASLSAKLGADKLKDEEEVKQGEIITYKTEVKNTGTTEAKGVKILAQLPEGVTVVDSENEQTIESIAPGETKEVEYKAQVSKDVQENSTITTKSAITYNEVNKETNAITNKVAEGNISVFVRHDSSFSDGGRVLVNDTTAYMAEIKNLTGTEQKNIKFSWNMPEELEVTEQCLATSEIYEKMLKAEDYFNDEGYKPVENSKELTIDSIPADSSIIVYAIVTAKDIKEPSQEAKISATVDNENKTYSSNEANVTIVGINDYKASMTANNENEYMKSGDAITYKINLKNDNEVASEVTVKDQLPKILTVNSVKVNGETVEEKTDNEVEVSTQIEAGEEKEVAIETIVNKKEGMSEDEEISNKATLYTLSGELETNEVSHRMMSNSEADIMKDENGNDVYTYKISGMVWEDQNADGARDDAETTVEGTNVQLLNIATNELAKKPNGETISATTASDGTYTLQGIPNGQYIVVFNYDASSYRLTEYQKVGVDANRNSNVVSKKLAINGEEKTYGVTDTITISENSISNINMGLAKSEKFDLQLQKFVNKITVQTGSGTQTFNYNEESLAKVELKAKEIAGSNAIIEYKIKVTNAGELEGYVKNIVDYLPKDLTFTSDLNGDWYEENGNVYNNSLANQKIAPGETKEVTLTVTKAMTEDNTGLINNLAEIKEDYNEAGMTDINSTPGNKTQGENDMGSADTIISIKTGGPILYTLLTIAVLIILAGGTYFIRKEIKMKDEII